MIHTQSIRGLQTAWVEAGTRSTDSPLYFLIHGFPDSPSIWQPLIERFGACRNLAVPYLRGVGPSEKGPKSRYSPTALAQDFLEIQRAIDPAQKRKVIVVGHDIGCDSAWEFARSLKKDLHCLVMLNGYSSDHFVRRIRNPKQALKSWYMGFFQIPGLPEKLIRGALKPLLQKALEKGHYPLSIDEALESTALIECYRQGTKFALKSLRTPCDPIQAPLHVLWGRRDKILEIPALDDFRGRAPSVDVRVLDAGHWLQYEIPEIIHAELLKVEA